MSEVLGIDFGQTGTKAATLDAGGKPEAIRNLRGNHCTPTVAHYGASGKVLVGEDAREQGAVEPRCTACSSKLMLGTSDNVLSNGQVKTATDVAADVIAAIKADAERQTSSVITDCIATCPANWHDAAKQALLEAYERNDLNVLSLVPEPTAAAIAYALHRASDGQRLAVYDLGGGTFDVSIVEANGEQLTVLATEGIPKLGGNDFTQCILDKLLNLIEAKTGKKLSVQSHPLVYYDLIQRAERAKISLGTQEQVQVVISVEGAQLIETITQDEYCAMCRPLEQQTFDACDRAVAAAKLSYDRIDRVVMVGGQSQSPQVQKALADHTGLVPRLDVDPEKAISFGAAIACAVELKRRGQDPSRDGRSIPAPNIFMQNIVFYDVGCCVLERNGTEKTLKNWVIIPKNTPIPCQRVDKFSLVHEEQRAAQIEILQGQPGAHRDDCILIGELMLDDLPPETARSERIQVEYTVDGNGMVTATATDSVSGKSKSVSVDYKKGVKPKPKPPTA